jgi:hypothetical protein
MVVGEMGYCFFEEMGVEEFVKRKNLTSKSKTQRKSQPLKLKPKY